MSTKAWLVVGGVAAAAVALWYFWPKSAQADTRQTSTSGPLGGLNLGSWGDKLKMVGL